MRRSYTGSPTAHAEDSVIVLDATPLASGHAVRGIGRFLDGAIGALVREEMAFVRDRVRLLVDPSQPPPTDGVAFVTSLRTHFRPQDIGWAVAALADRWAARRLRSAWWHQTDPMLPWSPMPASRTLSTAYDLIPLHEPQVWRAIRPHRRLIYSAYISSLRKARGIIAISSATADDLHRTLGIPTDRIRVVSPAVAAPPAGPRAAVDPDAPLLLFVGVTDPHKRPDLAVAALAELRRRGRAASLAFVGPSSEAAVHALQRVAAAHEVAGAVTFRGRVSDDELSELYRCGVLLAVSRIEGFGLPPVEAIVAGGRVVAVPTPVYREVLGDEGTYAANDQPAAIADAVEEILANPVTESARLSLAARVTPRKSAARLRAAYEELTG